MAHVSPSDPRSDDDKPVTMSEDGKEQKSAPSVDPGLTEEVEALKRTVSALLAERGQGSGGVPQEPSPDPNVLAEIERFQRMEACLYKHRKEWEANVGPGKWDFAIDYSPGDSKQRYRYIYGGQQQWMTCDMALRPERKYERPDIFDPALLRDVDIAKDSSEGGVAKDYYDTTIDWGNRRDRLRKNFEWELDRMFLREELQMKKLEQQKSDEGKKRRERRMAEADTQSGEEPKGDAALSGSQGSLDVGIAWSEWYRFKSLRQSDSKVVNMIDVLDGEPIVDDEGGADRFWSRSADRRVKETGNPSTGQKTQNSMDPAASPVPERIRVCSGPLLRTLAELLGPEGRPLLELEDMRVVFTRPYKVLSYREQDLRGWCDFLERQFEGSSSRGKALAATEESVASAYRRSNNTEVEEQDIKVATDKTNQYSINGQTNDTETSEQETHPTESLDDRAGHLQSETEHIETDGHEDSDNSLPRSVTAFRHLKTLLEFMDSSVAAKRNYLNSPQCRKVFFSDLWQLFRPGSEVIGSDGKQAYRVIGVRSAKHRVAPLWERWYRPSGRGRSKISKKSDFSITCVYIDFDGSNIGPVQKEFDIERFDGQREVTSLEVYPLRFHPIRRWEYGEKQWQDLESHPISERYRKRLINRGWAFLDVVRGKHMYYAGSTLDGKEEVESPVVIDFETAITTRDARLNPPDALAHRRGFGYENDEDALQPVDEPWKPKLSTLISIPEPEPPIGGDSCSGDCCRDEFVYDDQYVDRKQRQEYIESLLPNSKALDEQPPITIMPRPLKDLKLGPRGSFLCPDDELVIMSYRVFGFVLRSRKFAKLDLTHLSEVHTAQEPTARTPTKESSKEGERQADPASAFDRLVLEEGHSSMIVSLIAQHFRDKKSTTGEREEFDIVRGKGKGLIILLHGAPGVGKTSTAEGVAEKFKKPLFQITCGDLGTTASEVEAALEKNFSLANKWDCILLLDEADVFLTERSKEDFKRNGLVAVFLRLMEYYSGILFLTTNRVGDFDEAFTSRIHVSLYYPALNQEKTVKVFKINLDMIEDRFKRKGRVIKIERMEIGGFAAQYFTGHANARWNGRQIRNACQTALALAEFEAQGNSLQETEDRNLVVRLNVKHFEIVRDAYLEFTKYMHDLYGTYAARRAKESKLRAIVIDENANVVASQNLDGTNADPKTAFYLASRNPSGRATGHVPQQSIQIPLDQQHGRYQQQSSTFGTQQPQFQSQQYQPSQYQPQPPYNQPQQQPPLNQNWDQQSRNSGGFGAEPHHEGQFRGSTPRPQQASPSPNRQQQAQTNPPLLDENIRSMYAASGQPGYDQTAAGASGGNRGPSWSCPSCGNLHSGSRSGFCSACG